MCRCEQGGMLTATMRLVDSQMCTHAHAGLLQWRVLADNLPTSGTFEWKVPESCVQGPYMIQAKLKGAAAARRQAPAGKSGNGSMIAGLGSLVGGGGAAAAILSPALRLYVRDELSVVAPCAGTQWHAGALEHLLGPLCALGGRERCPVGDGGFLAASSPWARRCGSGVSLQVGESSESTT